MLLPVDFSEFRHIFCERKHQQFRHLIIEGDALLFDEVGLLIQLVRRDEGLVDHVSSLSGELTEEDSIIYHGAADTTP